MRFHRHSAVHWFIVAVIAALALFTFNHAWGQSANAGAAFEGRPAMAGAQGGLGAQGGMAQGGIGVQGNEAAQRQLKLRKPSGLDSPVIPSAPEVVPLPGKSDVTLVPKKDGVAKEVRSPVRKVRKAARRALDRSRTPPGDIAGAGGTPN